MRYIRLKCPKCGTTKQMPLEELNLSVRFSRPFPSCPNCHWSETEVRRAFDNTVHLEIEETFDHCLIISEPISKVEKRNSL